MPASLPRVDPRLALEPIDPKRYPEFPDHFAISSDGLKAHLVYDRRRKQTADDALTKETGARRLAEEHEKESERLRARDAFWADYGTWIGIGGTLVLEGIVIGAAVLLKR